MANTKKGKPTHTEVIKGLKLEIKELKAVNDAIQKNLDEANTAIAGKSMEARMNKVSYDELKKTLDNSEEKIEDLNDEVETQKEFAVALKQQITEWSQMFKGEYMDRKLAEMTLSEVENDLDGMLKKSIEKGDLLRNIMSSMIEQ